MCNKTETVAIKDIDIIDKDLNFELTNNSIKKIKNKLYKYLYELNNNLIPEKYNDSSK